MKRNFEWINSTFGTVLKKTSLLKVAKKNTGISIFEHIKEKLKLLVKNKQKKTGKTKDNWGENLIKILE